MNGPNDIHIMVDLETFSNDTRMGAVLAIGAVAFTFISVMSEPLSGEYEFSTGGQNFFLPVEIAGQREFGLETAPETLQWWFADDDRCRILSKYFSSLYTRPIKTTLEAFASWIRSMTDGKKIYMWSHGVTYDCVHLAEKWPKIMGASLNTICPFRQMRDTRTLYAVYEMKYGWKPYPQWAKKDHPMKHHPLYDAYVQAVAVQIAINGLLAPTSN